MTDFIDEFRDEFGVEPICRVLPIAPSTYHARQAILREPARASRRAHRDGELRHSIREVWSANRGLYGARKVWHALRQGGVDVARCTVERLMQKMSLRGVMRGKVVRAVISDRDAPCRPWCGDRRVGAAASRF